MPGRVGDSPIAGAGIYADDEIGAAGATGHGEELWRGVASFRTLEAIRRGLSPRQACEETVLHILRRHKRDDMLPCVVFAINKEGEYGAACVKREFHLWACHDGEMTMTEYQPLDLGVYA